MKKVIFTLLCMCLCAPVLAADPTDDEQRPTDSSQIYQDKTTGFYFFVIDGNAHITYESLMSDSNYASYDLSSFSIPETVQAEGGEEYPVTRVGTFAFYGAPIKGEVVVPDHLTAVGSAAFMNCSGITDVTIEYAETTLSDENVAAFYNMFYNNTSLKTITLNRDVNSRSSSAYGAFSYQHTVTTITIGANVTSIPDMMFRDDKQYHTITSVTCYAATPPTMSSTANPFERCFSSAGAVALYVPETSIEKYKASTAWTDIFGDNFVAIPDYVVPDDPSEGEQPEGTLKDVTTGLYFAIDESTGVVSIIANQESGTYSNDNLVALDDGSYTLPETVTDKSGTSGSVTVIGEAAFMGSSISGHIVIPGFITDLGKQAFYGVTTITEVTIAEAETAINEDNNGNWYTSFYNCSGITTVHLNRDVKTARGYAGTLEASSNNNVYRICPFSELTNIETIYIGKDVTYIAYNMFNCNATTCALKDVYCYATTPPQLQYKAFGSHSDLTLHVYESAYNAYESYEPADGYEDWNSFFSTIKTMANEEEEQPEGTLKDVTTGLYFDVDEDSVVSIIAHDGTTYNDTNLVSYDDSSWTIPATVTDSEGNEYSVTRIGDFAFSGSAISGHIVIPAYITNMAEGAFMNSTGITEVTFEYSDTNLLDEKSDNNTTATQAFAGCSDITTVNLNRDITIGHSGNLCGAFVYQSSITTINIGSKVTEIPDYYFRNTSTHPIKAINVYAINPPTFSTSAHPFDRLDDFTLAVPYGSADDYKASDCWKVYIESADASSDTGNCTFVEMDNAYSLAIESEDEDGKYYATFYCGEYNIELEGATAYVVSDMTIADETGYLEITEIGSIVPAATAVIIAADAEASYAAYATTKGEAYTGTNYLLGYDKAQTTTGPDGEETGYVYYMLSYDQNEQTLGFYYGAEDGAAFTSAAHKAYLAIPETIATSVRYMSLKAYEPGEETGITEVGNSVTDGKLYDLAGRRVVTPIKGGVYITNGKKVVF